MEYCRHDVSENMTSQPVLEMVPADRGFANTRALLARAVQEGRRHLHIDSTFGYDA